MKKKTLFLGSIVAGLAATLVPIQRSGASLRVAEACAEPVQPCWWSPGDFCAFIGGPDCGDWIGDGCSIRGYYNYRPSGGV